MINEWLTFRMELGNIESTDCNFLDEFEMGIGIERSIERNYRSTAFEAIPTHFQFVCQMDILHSEFHTGTSRHSPHP